MGLMMKHTRTVARYSDARQGLLDCVDPLVAKDPLDPQDEVLYY